MSLADLLNAYVQGTAEGPEVALLDKFIRDRIAKQVGGAQRVSDTAVLLWLKRYEKGGMNTQASAYLDQLIAQRAPSYGEYEDDEVEDDEVEDEDEDEDDEVEDELTPTPTPTPSGPLLRDAKVDAELTRAHDWRFHLESAARDALAALVRRDLEAAKARLKRGITWAP